MRSMYNAYALEHKNKDGSPNGSFVMDKAACKKACEEVLATHKGLSGTALTDYMGTYFEKTWGHFDVNRIGEIEVWKMPQVVRFLASDQYFQFI